MFGEIIRRDERSAYVRCAPDDGAIESDQDVVALLGRCAEADSNRIMLCQEHLHRDFFDLETGLAGAIFLKLTNYRVRTAIVADLASIRSKRFRELVLESNKGNEINFFSDADEAEQWLVVD